MRQYSSWKKEYISNKGVSSNIDIKVIEYINLLADEWVLKAKKGIFLDKTMFENIYFNEIDGNKEDLFYKFAINHKSCSCYVSNEICKKLKGFFLYDINIPSSILIKSDDKVKTLKYKAI